MAWVGAEPPPPTRSEFVLYSFESYLDTIAMEFFSDKVPDTSPVGK